MAAPKLDATKVRSALTGEFLLGTKQAAAPTGISGATTGYKGLGYFSNDGFKIKPERKSDSIIAWQNADVVRSITSEAKLEISFTMIETSKDTMELFWQTTVKQAADGGQFDINPGASSGRFPAILDVIDGEELQRYYFPAVELTEREEITGKNGEILGYGVTLAAYPGKLGADGATGAGRVWMTGLKAPA